MKIHYQCIFLIGSDKLDIYDLCIRTHELFKISEPFLHKQSAISSAV